MLNLSIANLIKRQAEKNPFAVCIAAPNRQPLTYRSLYNCIEDIGAHLQAMGLGRNDRVAVVLPNSPEMAVAFLAVAAVCTCAPLNPNYRAVEFDFYLSDLQAKALIIQSGTNSEAQAVAQERGIPILEISPMLEAEAGIFTFKGANKHTIFSGGFASAGDVALVLHTSGTTARPKIVPLTHANLCTSANNIQATLKLSEQDCCLNVMPLFHIHGLIGTLLSSLSSGGSVVCTPHFDATKFFDWLLEFKPTWYSAVPTIHQAILAQASAAQRIINNCSIRLIRSSSAALPPQVMMALEEIFNAPVIEAYGMTEASHQMASNPLPPAVRKPGSVGVPAGLRIAIMDEFGNLLEPGAVGEIVIQGANVTSGYDNPQANVSAFTNGWFRTGDNGYFDNDGYLYIKGRIKEIINRGGEKISPREVDEVLLNHPAVLQAVTFAVPHPTLGEDVAAALVLQQNATVTKREIYEFAFSRLADFKLPAQVVFVDEIPKGATGKLQRIGLAEKLAAQLKVAYVEPRNEIEKTVATIWIEVLGIEIVGIYDNFFALGGDSLRASQVIARMEAIFQVQVSLRDFFTAPTVINLSQMLNVAAKNVNFACKQIIQQNHDYPLPLSFAQQYFWFLAQLTLDTPAYNVANAMQIQGNLNVEFVQQAINAIVQRHALLRSTIKQVDGQLMQIIASHQVVLQQIALSTHLKQFIDEEIQRPFDLEQGPLLRVTLLRLEQAKYILLLVNHHIISDDWSIGLFWQEFTAFYEAFSTDQPSKLQALPIQYVDFAVWQRNHLQGEFLQSQLNYWKQQLKGELPLLQLPTDRVRPPVETFRGAYQSLTISKILTEELKNLSKSEGVTIFMTLLAAFKTLLYRYSNQEDILIITPISERNQVETERIIGCFVNNIILRTNLEGNPSFRELLQRVKTTALDAYAHQHLRFDKLIQQLQIERDTSQLPFQVMFVLHNAPKVALSLRDLTLTTLSIHTATAKLDLILELQETSEGIVGGLEYNTDLFDTATISRMVEHFQILLNGIIANPYQAISELPLLTPVEQHQLFEEQVENLPDAYAIAWEDQELMSKQFSCFLIGDEALVIAASEIVLKGNHHILGIITNSKAVNEFAFIKKIPSIPIDENLVKFLSARQFDYLFSIYNLYILPKQIIDLPRKMAINCHNSLLPKYGGRNATSWAIINREKIHGVTWHAMTSLVDRGDILKQYSIEISDSETAFSLKTKCFSSVIESFGELVDDLANSKLSLMPQNLQEKSYFFSNQKPTPGCIITWECCAYDLDALIRGLDFNILPNPVGLLKVYIGHEFFIVSNLEVLDNISKMPSGTVTKISSNGIQVSTLSNEIVLSGLKTLEGQPISIADLVKNYELYEGYKFSKPSFNIINGIEKLEALISKHEDFWLKRLNTLNLVSLPQMSKNATAEIERQYLSLNMLIPSVVTSFLKEQSGCDTGDFLLFALMAYLSRITGELCFDVGFSYSDLQSEVKELELFATYVPCRINITNDRSFANCLDSLREQVEVTKRHKTFARDMVVRYPTLQRGLNIQGNDTFPIVVEQVKQLKDIKLHDSHNLIIAMTEDGTECCWIYDCQSFTPDTIERMVEQFATFLRGIVIDASASISVLPLLTEAERHQMLVDWNNTFANYPIDKCIHQLFEAQVEQNPEAIAVVFENQKLTYSELNCRANQLANYLQSLGVAPEVLVGIFTERSIEMLVGILGILKAGGAYVPLDPTYPSERLNYMLLDSRVPVMLTMANLSEKLPQHQATVICLDVDWKKIAHYSESNPISLVKPNNLAYVIYTSGSTGKPKGVLIQHKSLVNYTWFASSEYLISKRDRVLQFASLSFDASAEEIYICLTRGATLILRTDSMLDSVDIFLQKCLDLKLTVVALPTAYWHELTAICSQENLLLPPSLRLLIIGGEKALPERLKTWLEYVGQRVRLVNSYGPTEATIVTTIHDLSVANAASTELPIGRPIANVQTYILDRYQQPLPIGVPGELYIAGDGLARGYLNQPDLTDEKFIPNPFNKKPGSRLYKTGDLVRYLPDGNIEFLGRIDNQVKVRGFRIELGEIESKLAKHSKVKETVVVARENIAGDKQLVAYIIFNTELPPTIGDLRLFLKEQLPDYMIPSAFVTLDALPLTPNGKVDRSLLPAVSETYLKLERVYIAPQNQLERGIANIWEKVLGIDCISIYDNFFELGGHSLLALQLITQIEQKLSKKLLISTLLQAPTIKQLASILHQENSVSSIVEVTPLNGNVTPLFWCTPHLNYNLNLLAKYMGTEQPLLGLDGGYFNIENPDTHIKDYAAHYVKEIRAIQPNGPYKLGGYCMGGLVAFEIAQQLRAQDEEVKLLALVERSGLNPIHRRCVKISVAIDGHINNLTQFNLTQQLIYIWKLIQKLFTWSLLKLKKDENQQESDLNTSSLNATSIYQKALKSVKKYSLQQPYPGNIILLFAEKNNYLSFLFPKYGWGKAVTGKIICSLVPGNHVSVTEEPDIQQVAAKLKFYLDSKK